MRHSVVTQTTHLPLSMGEGIINAALMQRGIPSPVGGCLGWGHVLFYLIHQSPLPTSSLRGEEFNSIDRLANQCRNFIFYILCICFIASTSFAAAVEHPLSNPEQEQRAQALFYELRCVVCQSESVAQSPAQIAMDIRTEVRNHITQGKSDEEIKAFLVSRYGDFILMKPPLNTATVALWTAPFMLLLLGFFAARRLFSSIPPKS